MDKEMTGNTYQGLAMRTMNHKLDKEELREHALHGLTSEIGEIHGIYQKKYQGHEVDENKVMDELSDVLWFAAELCYSMGWELDDVMQHNIEKLKLRYPEGFSVERSKNRLN